MSISAHSLVLNGLHATISTIFSLPRGIMRVRGPKLAVAISEDRRGQQGPPTSCELYLSFNLPRDIFVDPHELALRRGEYEYRLWGSRDVEKPAHAVEEGQVVLLDLTRAATESLSRSKEHRVDAPLHLRYAAPAEGGHAKVSMRSPVGFWACPWYEGPRHRAHDSVLPKQVVETFGSNYSIHAIPRDMGVNANLSVSVPVGNVAHLRFVESTSAVVLIACFIYLLSTFIKAARRLDAHVRAKRPKAE